MKPLFRWCCAIAAMQLCLALAGCATEPSALSTRGSSNSSAMGAGIGMMDTEMAATCRDMREKMAAATTPQERQAILKERMPWMTPAMLQRMQEHAKTCL